mmetsp:Transcript_25945/g.47034  ORF Transcript_25945/g.47034 Transcript_25945/m.47034 type:complete len:80 (-) Transcript_25945:2346-2585(-)
MYIGKWGAGEPQNVGTRRIRKITHNKIGRKRTRRRKSCVKVDAQRNGPYNKWIGVEIAKEGELGSYKRNRKLHSLASRS